MILYGFSFAPLFDLWRRLRFFPLGSFLCSGQEKPLLPRLCSFFFSWVPRQSLPKRIFLRPFDDCLMVSFFSLLAKSDDPLLVDSGTPSIPQSLAARNFPLVFFDARSVCCSSLPSGQSGEAFCDRSPSLRGRLSFSSRRDIGLRRELDFSSFSLKCAVHFFFPFRFPRTFSQAVPFEIQKVNPPS